MKEVFMSEIAGYNETDHACNGGFYNCPNCGSQIYVSQSENMDENDCDECGEIHVILED